VFAGKAHPKDHPGQEILKQIAQFARRPAFRDRFVFLEGYDVELARYLVQGADVWLNVPLRPYEASGTSGMKAAANGALNLSIPDGWWAEGYRGDNGWSIGEGTWGSTEEQDARDGEALYKLLEEQVVPTYYERDEQGLPRGWVAMMKASIESVLPTFSAHRMVRDYVEQAYLPAARRGALSVAR
jgi:starch phosphorylase